MDRYQIVDEKIGSGYRYLVGKESNKACDKWLSAWEDIKQILSEEKLKDLEALQKKYDWSEFLSNYIQDLELELHNAGQYDEEYIHKRIKYCNEMIKLCDQEDELIIENTKRAIADSYFILGNAKESDKLYSQWLKEDPTWGWGYIGWSDCYSEGTKRIKPNIGKAEEIIRTALEERDVRDRADVLERAIEIYINLKQNEKADELEEELKQLKKLKRQEDIKNLDMLKRLIKPEKGSNTPTQVIKIGRNEPCPCGSGKKYKKCCGK